MIMGTSCAHVMGRLSTINAALNSYLSGTCPLRWQPNNPMLHPRYNFAAIKVFKRIAVLGGSCPTIDLHDVLQYDPKMDMWGYQSLSMVNTTSDAKCQTRRSKMRKRASIGRSLMSTLGVRSKLCAAVIKIPSSVSVSPTVVEAGIILAARALALKRSTKQNMRWDHRRNDTESPCTSMLLQAHNRSVCQEVDDYEQEFGSINMPSGEWQLDCGYRCQQLPIA
eukprot:TRINITY_DN12109_c0_g1_i10.p1 TRINITY_DN12109_c0_g1~~TRINITY_DN12109_c0_g1_i10.p1  ORF type:complete len:223 (+),score=37.20 TRINITY_DN12109_c0_g1_i10:1218-1886(+)